MNGHIIYLNRERGFGHVRSDDADGEAGVELFFHYSDLVDETIAEFSLGHHVSFVPIMTWRGPAAADVRHRVLHGTVVMLRIGTPGQTGYGYAFVAPDRGGEDLFCHHTRVTPAGPAPGESFAALRKGDRVQYRECRGRVGQRDRAIDVRLLAERPAEGPWHPQFINTPIQEPTMTTTNTQTDTQNNDDTHAVSREGTVARLAADRGYGFIRPHNAKGRDGLFFHMSALLPPGTFDSLRGGERVTYAEGAGRDGRPCATDVRLLDADADDTAVA